MSFLIISFCSQAKRLITNEFAAIKVIKLEPGEVFISMTYFSAFLTAFHIVVHFLDGSSKFAELEVIT